MKWKINRETNSRSRETCCGRERTNPQTAEVHPDQSRPVTEMRRQENPALRDSQEGRPLDFPTTLSRTQFLLDLECFECLCVRAAACVSAAVMLALGMERASREEVRRGFGPAWLLGMMGGVADALGINRLR